MAVVTSRPVAWVAGVGESSGIGASVAARFAVGGFTVAVTGRRREVLDQTAAAINSRGGHAIAVAGDVTDEDQVRAMGSRIEELGVLEAAVYNAGNNRQLSLMEMPAEDFETLWRVVCFGAFITGRTMLKPMIEKGRGTLLFTGATASLRGRPPYAAFSSAKAGVRMLAQAFAREVGPLGVHVAHVIIDGKVEGEGAPGFTGWSIAESYWMLHQQPKGAWSQEIDLRSSEEVF